MEEERKEMLCRAKENLRRAKEKDKGKVAVRCGGPCNTIVMVGPGRDVEEVKRKYRLKGGFGRRQTGRPDDAGRRNR